MDERAAGPKPDEHSAVYPFPGDSVMAARMRGFEWTSFGSPPDWPSSLRVACRICLTSRFPVIVWWGPQLRLLYNDAYLPLLGSRHPALGDPGQQVWAEIWHIIGPMLAGVLRTGEATWSADLLLPMDRHGYWEETYWTYSYSPLHDDDGSVRGVFTAATDTTQRVIAERRLAALQDLGSQAGTARTEAEACELIAASLARANLDIPFAAIYLRQPGTDELILTACSPAGAAPAPRSGGPGGWPLAQVLRDGRQVALADVLHRFGELPGGGWDRSPTEAMVLPLHGETGAQPLGVMVLAASAGRTLDRPYRTFLELVARQAAGLINGAVAYRAEQRRAEQLAELDRARTVFFSNVSHEFRTLLTLIMGPLEELRSAVGTGRDPKLREELDMMYRNGLRLTKLVNTLLDFSRLPFGHDHLPPDNVRTTGTAAGTVTLAQPFIEEALRWLPADDESQVFGPEPPATASGGHAEWRAAFIDSLQEGFFVCDASGAVVEINESFSALLGYGADGLPYSPPFPWWPDPAIDPDGRAEVEAGLARSLWDGSGSHTRLFRHRDGRLVWVALTYTTVPDPDGTGQRILVGTIRDITAQRLAAEREVALTRLTARLSEAGSVHDVLEAGLDELRTLWHARQGLATTWHRDGQATLVSTVPGARWPDLDAALREAITGIRGGRPLQVTVDGRGSSRSGAGTTLEYADGLVAIWLDLDPSRPFGVQDRAQLALMCGHLSQALHRAHSADQQRDVALTLQRSFLGPVDLPAGFAVRYEPAVRPLEVGGDWYDVIELPDNRMGLVVGDCVGRGLPAAAVMGQLRSACRALLLQATGPGETLTALDRFAAVIPDASCATLFCAILDRTDGTLRYSSAGHPPGILVHIDGEFELLEDARSVPLAAVPHAARTEATTRLHQGSLLLLYTDGLVERHRQLLGAGINRAADALVTGRTTPVNQLADYLMARLVPDEGFADDIAVLLYRHRCPRPTSFISSFPADPRQLADVRRGLRAWLISLGLAPIVADRLLVATGEACNNAIEHAYGFDGIHHVLVSAHTDDGELRITVADTGRWKPRPSDAASHRGHGLRLIEAFAPRFTIDTTQAGTTINLYAQIGRQPALPLAVH
jgi:PAS domain S-box-containing protein